MRETEQLHGKVRRYTSPDEHAFYAGQSAQMSRPCICAALAASVLRKPALCLHNSRRVGTQSGPESARRRQRQHSS
jgi:hypothetical protein